MLSGLFTVIVSLVVWAASAAAHDNGMDMSMDGPMNLAHGAMIPYLHFTPGDTVWFLGWVPQTAGAMVGACIGLFLLALVERWIAAVRAVMEAHWRMRSRIALAAKVNSVKDVENPSNLSTSSLASSTKVAAWIDRRRYPSFIPVQDISRGMIHLVQVTLGFAFMLVVMTYQVAFILSIVIGMGVGEIMFGRFIGAAEAH